MPPTRSAASSRPSCAQARSATSSSSRSGCSPCPAGEAARCTPRLVRVRGELAAIARGLYPQALLEGGLADALAGAAAGALTPVAIDSRLGSAAIPREIALTAYYVASEALVNVAKHARATHVRLELSASADELVMRVVDDGAGGADPLGRRSRRATRPRSRRRR